MQRLRRLARRRDERAAEGSFVVEGPLLVHDALDSGLDIEAVFAEPSARGELTERAMGLGIEVFELEPPVLARLADTTTPQGVLAIARTPRSDLASALRTDLVLVLVGISDPGNAGTLVRTAEAAGAGAVLFCADAVDPFAPKCVRASAGSVFHLPVVSGGDPLALLEQVAAAGLRRLGTTARDGSAYDTVDLGRPVAFVLGNEAHGLPALVEGSIDEWITIPMAGRTESLNVAMAGAVLCFEAHRQRRSAGESGR